MTTSLSKFRKTTLFVFLFKRCKLFKFKLLTKSQFKFRAVAVVLYRADAATAPVAQSCRAAAKSSRVAESSRVVPSKLLQCKLVPVAPIAVTKLDTNA